MSFGFFWGAPTADEESARQIVEPRRDPSDVAVATSPPEQYGADVDDSGATVGRAVSRGTSGYLGETVAAAPSDISTYDDGSGQSRLDESWATKGLYAAREAAGIGGHPGAYTSIAVAPSIGTHNILGGVTQYANERGPVADAVIAPVIQNTGENAAWAAMATNLGSSATFAVGMFD